MSDLRAVVRKTLDPETLLRCPAFSPVLYNNVHIGKQASFPDREKLLLGWQGSSMLREKVRGMCAACGRQRLLSAHVHGLGRVGADCFARLNTAHIAFATMRHWNTLLGDMRIKTEQTVQGAMQNMQFLLEQCHEASESTMEKYTKKEDYDDDDDDDGTEASSSDFANSQDEDEDATSSSSDDDATVSDASYSSSAASCSSSSSSEEATTSDDDEESEMASSSGSEDEVVVTRKRTRWRVALPSAASRPRPSVATARAKARMEWATTSSSDSDGSQDSGSEAEEDVHFEKRRRLRRGCGLGYVASLAK